MCKYFLAIVKEKVRVNVDVAQIFVIINSRNNLENDETMRCKQKFIDIAKKHWNNERLFPEWHSLIWMMPLEYLEQLIRTTEEQLKV